MHSHDRCSADDLYFEVVRGLACLFLFFALLILFFSKVTFRLEFFLTVSPNDAWREIPQEIPSLTVLIHFVPSVSSSPDLFHSSKTDQKKRKKSPLLILQEWM